MWEDDMVEMLRVFINDMGDTPTYSDETLLRVLVTSAFQVSQELDFLYDFVASLSGQTISPDPTLTATKDESYVNLTCMKAACIIDRGSAAQAASRAIAVRDGGSSVDLRGVFTGKLAILKEGWCKVYETSKTEYQANSAAVAGAMVLTPFRLYPHGGLSHGGYLGFDASRDREGFI